MSIQIISNQSLLKLRVETNKLIEQGYIPLGEVKLLEAPLTTYYFQVVQK